MKYIKKTANLQFEETVTKELEQCRGKKLLVAFSGGKDSLALLEFFYSKQEEYSFAVAACHVNHGLRAEAHIEEEFCRRYCAARSIPFVAKNVAESLHGDISKGIEDAARRERYRALSHAAAEFGSEIILTAHTLSDLLESFFVDLYTGASIFTLGGISKNVGNIFRPLLGVTTEQVEAYLESCGLTPIYDVSNADTDYTRNCVRHKVMPTLFSAGDSFVNTVLRLQKESVKLARGFADDARRCIVLDSDELVVLDKKVFLSFADILREYTLGSVFSGKFRACKTHIAEALSLFERDGSRRADLPDGFVFEVSYNSIKLFKNSLVSLFSVEKESGIGNINISDVEIFFSPELAKQKLTIRNRRNGDRFRGCKLKDLFIDKKIGLFERDRAVIVTSGADILWVEYLSQGDAVTVKRQV